MGRRTGIAIFVALVANVIMLVACGGEGDRSSSESMTSEVKEKTQASDGMNSERAESTELQLPEGFPSDLPVYTGAKFVRSLRGPGGSPAVLLESGDDIKAIARFYQATLKEAGWKERPVMGVKTGSEILSFRKGKNTLTIQITEGADKSRIHMGIRN